MTGALRSAGGFRRLLRSLTRKSLIKCDGMKWTERSMVLGANWRLANAKSSTVHQNNPDAACMDGIEMTGRKSSLQANITPADKLRCEWLQWFDILVGRADFDFFVRFENTASCVNARWHAGSSQLRALVCLVAH